MKLGTSLIFLLSSSWSSSVGAFTAAKTFSWNPTSINAAATTVVSPSSSSSSSSALHAEGGPPQYEKRTAILREAEIVGDGSVLLHLEREENGDDDNEPWGYEPGHVLALEIQGNADDDEVDDKTIADMARNDGWMRGPYTVSRATDRSMDILLKVVGAKSKAFAAATPGTRLRFGGKFKVPIVEGISATDTERIVMISTGVGVGPCVGAVEKLLSDKQFAGTIDLFASYRHESEIMFADYLNVWSTAYESFRYKPVITSEIGRLSSSEETVRLILKEDICPLRETHYHLIGNGQMVAEWKTGLSEAGVPDKKITVESYFNHKEKPSQDVIDRIAEVVRAGALNPVN